MIVFRGCARCEGDQYLEQDITGNELVCLQCGARRTLNAPALRRQAERQLQPAGR